MIRITELERTGPTVRLKLEGELDGCAMGLLSQTCAAYARSDVREVHLVVDGLRGIDPFIKGDLRELLSSVTIRFRQPGFFVRKLLQSWEWLEEKETP